MANTVGAVSCDRVVGDPRFAAEKVELFRIPGVDGIGIHQTGKAGDPSQWRLVKYGNETDCASWHSSVINLTGTIVDITSEVGRVATSQLIRSVGPVERRPAFDLVGSTVRFEVVIEAISV